MKWVRIRDGLVTECIPDEATKPSVSYWYNELFARECMQVPEKVDVGWVYNNDTKECEPPKRSSTALASTDKLRSDVDYLAALQGVSL